MTRPSFLAVTALATVLTLTGCAVRGAGGTSAQPTFDQQFIDMMVPHHQAAVEMAKVAQGRAERPEITQLAGAITGSQDSEIARMKGWRAAWFGSDQTPPMNTMPMLPGMAMPGHRMGSSTMDMAADVEKLRTAPPPFDRAFIDAMIPHHQSAIEAAKAAETRAQRPEIKQLAGEIARDQQREIDQMRAWRRAWYGSAAP